MTTQEKIAKHLGVNLNEAFSVEEWLAVKPLHIDPNMGVVTQDGNRLSNVLLQELLFGNCTITKLDRFKTIIPHKNYHTCGLSINADMLKLYDKLTDYTYDDVTFNELAMEEAKTIAKNYMNDISNIKQYHKYINLCFEETDYMDDASCLESVLANGISYAIELLVYDNIEAISYNMLANYIEHVGLDTVKTKTEITDIIDAISKHTSDDNSYAKLKTELDIHCKD